MATKFILGGLLCIMDALSEYTEAVKHYTFGDKKAAALHVSRSVGSNTTLPLIESGIDRIMNPSNGPLGPMLLRLMEDKNKHGL